MHHDIHGVTLTESFRNINLTEYISVLLSDVIYYNQDLFIHLFLLSIHVVKSTTETDDFSSSLCV
jgi:hypothetical protein